MQRIQCRKDIPEILKQLLNLRNEINVKSEILARLREMSQTISVMSFSHAPNNNKHNSRRSKVEETAVKILSVEEVFQNDIKELSELTEKFSKVLEKIDDVRCRELLTYRYLCGNTWEQVAEKMDYSFVHVINRLHPKAVRLLEDFDLRAI